MIFCIWLQLICTTFRILKSTLKRLCTARRPRKRGFEYKHPQETGAGIKCFVFINL
jgi:hypothetical protein